MYFIILLMFTSMLLTIMPGYNASSGDFEICWSIFEEKRKFWENERSYFKVPSNLRNVRDMVDL